MSVSLSDVATNLVRNLNAKEKFSQYLDFEGDEDLISEFSELVDSVLTETLSELNLSLSKSRSVKIPTALDMYKELYRSKHPEVKKVLDSNRQASAQWKKEEAKNSKVFQELTARALELRPAGSLPRRDPNAPRRVSKARDFFLNKMLPSRGEGVTVKEARASLCEEWNKMSDKKRAPFEKQEKADRSRFNREMESYVPSEGYSENGYRERPVFSPLDPLAPRRPPSAFEMFKEEVFERKHPTTKRGVLRTKAASRWAKETKAKSEVYRRYTALHREANKEFERLSQSHHTEFLLPERPPTSGYNLFIRTRNEERGETPKAEYRNQVNDEWKSLSAEDKLSWRDRVSQLHVQYNQGLESVIQDMESRGAEFDRSHLPSPFKIQATSSEIPDEEMSEEDSLEEELSDEEMSEEGVAVRGGR